MTGTGIAAIICLALTVINLASLAIARRRLGRPDPASAGLKETPVTVVRPVCGLETYSEETLGSGFRLAYPNYELIRRTQHNFADVTLVNQAITSWDDRGEARPLLIDPDLQLAKAQPQTAVAARQARRRSRLASSQAAAGREAGERRRIREVASRHLH